MEIAGRPTLVDLHLADRIDRIFARAAGQNDFIPVFKRFLRSSLI